ncbi:MAG TPA: Do family serine endopeptidase [Polyangiaceae bacterium]|nr:Do family serine endopeptidase [Polyangiaceae bacterium]
MLKMSRYTKSWLVSLLLFTASCQRAPSGAPPAQSGAPQSSEAAKPSPLLPLPTPSLARVAAQGQNPTSIADVVERVMPSVVSISSTRVAKNRMGGPGMEDPFFRFFFGPPNGEQRERKEQGLGSGVVVGEGIVVTNNHVVEDADEIRVTAFGHREFPAELVGNDPKSDLAVLRIKDEKKELKALALGDSARLRLGDVVLAIGNPFGVGQTVTMGIVSAKGRSDLGILDYEDFIQTDAAINPGNSGGALVDMEGNLVGINTAILSRSGGNVGIGFAIPTAMARPIVDSLLSKGRVDRGWLGVTIQNLDPDLAKGLGVKTSEGVVISDVAKGSPAEKAGLRRDDVILSVDNRAVTTTGELRNAIATAGGNHTAQIKIQRGGTEMVIAVPLSSSPDKVKPGEQNTPSKVTPKSDELLGVRLETLTPELRRRLDLPPDVKGGVVVTNISPDSPLGRSGLRPGDLILEVSRQPVNSPDDVQRLFKASKGPAPALVWRSGSTTYVVLKKE